MQNKLYVGNISFQSDENSLKDAFGQFGTVTSVKIITDFETGRSKGFGFIEMENEQQAQDAISNLEGQEVGGRNIRVNLAKEREQKPRRPRS